MIRAVGFTAGGREAVTGCDDGAIRVWDAATGDRRRRIEVGEDADPGRCFISFSADGVTALVSGWRGAAQPDSRYQVSLWDTRTGARRGSLDEHRVGASGAPMTANGMTLATPAPGGGVRLWDVGTGKRAGLVEADANASDELALSPEGKTLAIVQLSDSNDGEWRTEIALWDAGPGKGVRRWARQTGTRGFGLAFAPDGRTVAMNECNEVGRWDAASGKELPPLHVPKGDVAALFLSSLAFSPDGRTVAAGGWRGGIVLWETSTTRVRAVLKGHRDAVLSLAFSPDNDRLISGSKDTTALIWDLTGLADQKERPRLTDERLAALWDDLAADDAGKAWRAAWRLAADPDKSVPFLRTRLRPAAIDLVATARSLAALDADDFDEREAASRRLAGLGDAAEPALRRALAADPPPEARRRLKELLGRPAEPVRDPDKARALRGVEVLEYAGTPEARALLEDLSKGAEGAAQTRDAQASLARPAKPGR